jgi:hypothetical protein
MDYQGSYYFGTTSNGSLLVCIDKAVYFALHGGGQDGLQGAGAINN